MSAEKLSAASVILVKVLFCEERETFLNFVDGLDIKKFGSNWFNSGTLLFFPKIAAV